MKNGSEFDNVVFFTPDYLDIKKYEEFDLKGWRSLMSQYWTISIPISALYVALIFWGQKRMREREAFSLRIHSIVWNAAFGIFSFWAFSRGSPELFSLFANHSDGFYKYVCSWEEHNSAAGFWGFVYTISKFVELWGTAFIVLKKHPLLFLHWYHHITAFIYAFYIYQYYDTTMRWSGVTNSFAHGIVYTYFVIKGLTSLYGYKIAKHWAMKITGIQLLEMFGGIVVNLYTYKMKNSERGCGREMNNIIINIFLYALFAILFAHYFYTAYLDKSKKKNKPE